MMRRRVYNKNNKKVLALKGRGLFLTTGLLFLVGIYAIFSATSPLSSRLFGNQYHLAVRHTIFVIIGMFVLIIASKMPIKFWSNISNHLFFLSIILLLIVFLPGIGVRVLGASRWINLGFTSIQPSEIAKFSIILYFASLKKSRKEITSYLVPMFIICGLVLVEPDLGTMITIAAIAISLMFVAEVNLRKLILLVVVSLLFGLLMIFTSSYRRDRFMTYIGYEKDTLGKSYHINQVLYALGSGGLFGVGIGESKQKYLYLPETATDSIFPIFAEEFGFVGATMLILLIILYIYKFASLATSSHDEYAKMFLSGVASWVAIQSVLNIGSMVAIFPLTGIPLPFISYGGTSIIMLSLATGIAINIEKNAKN